MSKIYVTLAGKALRRVARLRGGGSALPGLFVERIDRNYIKDCLSQLPMGTVVISGTNGKTTTTKMVVALLESQGLRVFTNRTGSNFTRGVAASLIGEVNYRGVLTADIAVLELDEAHAVKFVKEVRPEHCLLLNVMRDQLDRFGEIDNTANMLGEIAKSTTTSVVLNREDRRVANIASKISLTPVYYGLAQRIKHNFPTDDVLYGGSESDSALEASVTLESFSSGRATYKIAGTTYETPLELNGIYNAYNAAGALALVGSILGEGMDAHKIVEALARVKPAHGRGESVTVKGQPLEVVLVKNPSGFRLGLASFSPDGYKTMIAINDQHADGRDMSWLWDVDFSSLSSTGVDYVTGVRAYDMALRLRYDRVGFSNVDTDIDAALDDFITSNPNSPKRIYCTYTAMLHIRKSLGKYTKVEAIS